MKASGKLLEVRWHDGRTVGYLRHTGPIYFSYDSAWLQSGHSLSPLSLEFGPQPVNCLAEGCEGVPGFIADSLPDGWGRRVAAKIFSEQGWGTPTTMKLLAWIGSRGMGALTFHPAAGDSETRNWLERVTAEGLAKEARALMRGEPASVIRHLAEGGTAGGAHPKSLVMAHADGSLSVARESSDPADQAGILKLDIAKPAGATCVEYAFIQMAAAARVVVPGSKLIIGADGRRHLLIRRFDRVASRRIHMHSLSGLWHRPKAGMGYEELFRAAVRLGLPAEELRQLARRLVFNVLSANHDDHGRNHAFLYDEENRSWSASPAFDLTYTPGMLSRGLTINGEVHPSHELIEAFLAGVGIGTAESKAIFRDVLAAVDKWEHFAAEAGVPDYLRNEVAAGLDAARQQSAPKHRRGNSAPLPAPRAKTARRRGVRD